MNKYKIISFEEFKNSDYESFLKSTKVVTDMKDDDYIYLTMNDFDDVDELLNNLRELIKNDKMAKVCSYFIELYFLCDSRSILKFDDYISGCFSPSPDAYKGWLELPEDYVYTIINYRNKWILDLPKANYISIKNGEN